MDPNGAIALPAQLVNSIQAGECVLFLGAGVSLDSGAPSGRQLARELCQRFLPDEPVNDDLGMTVESIDAMVGRADLNRYIYEQFSKLAPEGALLSIPTFHWKSIYTMNFDTLLEDAYGSSANARQRVRPFYTDRDQLSRLQPDEVPLYKLHGCITRANHSDGRLAFTLDDMLQVQKNRGRFFTRLYEDLNDYPVLYVGFSRGDIDFRQVVARLEEAAASISDLRRGFALQPSFTDSQRLFWEHKKIVLVGLRAAPFFERLNEQLPEWAKYAPVDSGQPRSDGLQDRFPKITSSLIHEIAENFETIDGRIEEQRANTEEFFLGGQPNWGAIARHDDASRDLEDLITADNLKDRAFDKDATHFSLIHAEGGAGKTTLLRRIGANLALEWGQVVVSLKPFGNIDLLTLEKLATATNSRVYVLMDDAAEHARELSRIIGQARRSKLKLSFLGAARTNEWREASYDRDLEFTVEYELQSLTRQEITNILDTLERNEALGMLAGVSRESQISSFEERANKQLLVALREATAGKNFEEIILDEYANIPSTEGQQAYLLVASLHRFGIYTRAGLLHRCLKLPLNEIGYKVLEPTEKIVVSRRPLDGEDVFYTTRHPLIADILFDRKLVSDRRRLEFYSNVIDNLDLGYSSDLAAYRRLTRSHNREVLRDFEEHHDRRALMGQMIQRDPSDPYTLQHAAMMELDERNFGDAADYLKRALEIAPQDSAILDTQGRWYTRMAQEQKNPIVAEEYLASAEQIFKRNIQRSPGEPYGLRHLADTYIEWSTRAASEAERLRYIGLAYQALTTGIAQCISNSMLLQKQAEIEQEIHKDTVRARAIFAELLTGRPGDLPSRMLAASLEKKDNRPDEALSILVEGLSYSASEPQLHYEIANLMATIGGYEEKTVIGHFEAAMLGSIRDVTPRIAYGAYLFSIGRFDDSARIFADLNRLVVGIRASRAAFKFQYGVLGARVEGKVVSLAQSYGHVDFGLGGTSIFFRKQDVSRPEWNNMTRDSTLSFEVRFNLRGAIATSVRLLSTHGAKTTQVQLPI